MPEIDLTVIYMALEGDDKSAVEVVMAYTPELRAYARVLLGQHRYPVDDLVQETWLKIWRSGKSFDPERASFLTWARMLMHYVYLDYVRKQGRRPLIVSLDPDNPRADPAGSQQPDAEATLRVDVRAALFKLDLPKRTLVWLVDAEGWTLREAAKVVGLTNEADLNKARGQLRRGRERLRMLLRSADPPSGPAPPPPAQRQSLKSSVERRTEAQ